MKTLSVSCIVGLLVILAGCAKPTEEQRLAKFRGSVKYKVYRLASEKTVGLAVTEYNKTQVTAPVDAALVHSTLGLLWFISNQSEYSFMEADVSNATGTNDAHIVSLTLKAMALHKMKCPGLARSQYEELKEVLATRDNVNTNIVEIEHKVALISIILVSLYHGDPDLAKPCADALGGITQLDYLPSLVGAVVEAKKGSPIKALEQLRQLNQSERFSEHKRVLIAEVSDIIANTPDKEKLGEEVTNRVLIQLAQRVLDDIFTAENKRALLDKARQLPEMIGVSGEKAKP